MAPAAVSWLGRSRVKGSSEMSRMILLTVSMIGLQFAWGTEMTYGNPYLLSLGLSKSKLSLVWVAGPLSGLVMQPIIGVISDKSTSRFGRRRPFMLGGAVAVAVCLIVLAWAKEVVEFGIGRKDMDKVNSLTKVLAVVDIYVLDFVINISQSTCRTLVVDTLPAEHQQIGSAWVGRMSGIGQLLVYAIGSLDLAGVIGGFLGDTQFKKVCVIAAVAMLTAQSVTCWAVEERILVADGKATSDKGILSVLSGIYSRTLNLPRQIQAICWVQFWAWIGWFPFLFYSSTWVGEIYLSQQDPSSKGDALTEVGRAGSVAMIVFAIISFCSSVVLPWMVRNPEENAEPTYTPRPPPVLGHMIKVWSKSKPSLQTTWMLANIAFACSMVFAPFVRSVGFATLLIAFCGIPWTVACWAPGTFLGIEVNRMSSYRSLSHNGEEWAADRASFDFDESDHRDNSSPSLHLRHDSDASDAQSSSTGELSGVYFGILNIYTTLPQFVGTGISWVVFSIFEPGQSTELTDGKGLSSSNKGISGIGVCLFIGALSALGSAWATRHLKPG